MPGTFSYAAATNTVTVTGGTTGSPADFASFVAAEIEAREDRLTQLQDHLDSKPQSKTKPGQETLDFYNFQTGMTYMPDPDNQIAQLQA